MDCFTDIIAIKDNCAGTESTSGLLSNDIGIGLEELNKINNSDYPSGDVFFEAKKNFAIKQVVHDISAQLAGKYKINTVVEGSRLGFYNDNLKAVTGIVDTLKGIEFDLCNTNSYLDMYVSSISLLTDFSGDITVSVFDLIQNKEIDTIVVPCVKGEISEKLVNKTYKSDRKKLNIIFVYDTTTINSYSSTITKGYCKNCSGTSLVSINSYVKARGVSVDAGSTKIKSNLSSSSDTAGMSIVYSLQCNHTDWLCTIANLLAMPILYRYGMEVAKHALNSSNRVNTQVREKQNAWENKLAGWSADYEKTLGDVLRNMNLPSDSKCFACDSRSKYITMLP